MHYTRAQDEKPTRRVVRLREQEFVIEVTATDLRMWPLRARLAKSVLEVSWDDIYHWFCDPDAEAMTPETAKDPTYIVNVNKMPPELRQKMLDGDWLTPARIK